MKLDDIKAWLPVITVFVLVVLGWGRFESKLNTTTALAENTKAVVDSQLIPGLAEAKLNNAVAVESQADSKARLSRIENKLDQLLNIFKQ